MMTGAGLRGGAAWGLALAAMLLIVAPTARAQDARAQDEQCSAPRETRSLEHAPHHFRERIVKGLPLKIVTIGSSSTFGTGASAPDKTYPSRLEAELKAKLPGLP